MKIPVSPPKIEKLLANIMESDLNRGLEIIGMRCPVDDKGRYLHWDKLRHLQPPTGLSNEEWWVSIKMSRRSMYKNLPLKDKHGNFFKFALPDSVLSSLHWIGQTSSGVISSNTPILNTHTRDSYLIKSLVTEAISSSQLEGASTTRNVAKEMLRQKRPPRDRSEQMIFNNYNAMQFIRDIKDEKLTPSIIIELQKILTDKTLDETSAAGRLRKDSDDIHVVDTQHSNVLHTPPEARELEGRLEAICQFANDREDESVSFMDPVIRAILLHFMLAYDHPFVDGNGRTARALFYWSMANQGYWLMEFISISTVIKQSPSKYGKAYLYTETDEGDVTYFIIHQLEVIKEAVHRLHDYLDRKEKEIESAEKLLSSIGRLEGRLNFRQLSILKHALKHPGARYTIKSHQISHSVTYQTARVDLLRMADDMNLLDKRLEGKTFTFWAPSDLQDRLERLKNC